MKYVRMLAAVTAVMLAAVVLAACGNDSKDSGTGSKTTAAQPAANKGTIKIGNIAAITGPIPLGEMSKAVQAYFDDLNAKGGVNGYKVEVVVKDDKTDPALTARAARELVEQEKVIGLVGDMTLVGCAVNQKYLEANEIRSIMGGGAIPPCFLQPNVSPVNTGPTGDFRVALTYARDTLGKKKVCAIFTTLQIPYAPDVIKWYEEKYGEALTMADQSLTQKSNLDALFATAKSKGCEAIATDGTANQTGPMAVARDKQGLTTVPLVFMGSQYNPDLAKALGDVKEIYATSELLPFTEPDPKLAPMLASFKKHGVPVSGLSQFGWHAATMFTKIVSGIQGEVTKESYNKALLAATSVDTDGWTATPYAFGPDKAHNSNKGAKMVKIENGKWVVATPDWIVWG
ncbi:unannotated protein [freshwater metagenome]|uniref:Unannotated protein n=1 Tax=freshwater metagenome TaxID=449393 RepID=A0A6J7JDA8_9ZZZZ|nr:ABC transporter substrate-binding protein [Actinomycetota bacterium]